MMIALNNGLIDRIEQCFMSPPTQHRL